MNSDITQGSSKLNSNDDPLYPSVFNLSETDRRWVQTTLSEMSLYQRCAQMIMIPVYRSYMDSLSPDYTNVVDLVSSHYVGGIIMFQGTLKQEIDFIKSMQLISTVPLLVASDFEHGPGSRIDDALEFPHNMALGATLNTAYAYDMAKAIALESRLIGVHQNFAPVADINNNPLNPVINVRSFSESKFTVANFVSSYVLGTKHGRVISTVKHFPGHGNTEIDSHTDLPMINGSKKDLIDNELYPFIEAINSGVQSVMAGHLEVPAYDTLPSSISPKIITDLLINTLGFDGLVVTDAFNMDGIRKFYTEEEMILLAVKAGNDIILMPPDPVASIKTIYRAVLSGEISEERINKSVRKILSAKRWLGLTEENPYSTEAILDSLKNESHQKLAEEIASSSITLIKNERDIIPFDPSNYKNISCITVTDAEGGETSEYFQDVLKRRIGNVNNHLLNIYSSKGDYDLAYNTAKYSDIIFLPLFQEIEPEIKSERLRNRQRDFISKLLRLNTPSIVISFKNPYNLVSQPNVKTYLNVYSYSKVSQSAVLKAILGEEDISGKLPVSIPATNFNIGYGVRLDKSITTELSLANNSQYNFTKLDEVLLNSLEDKTINRADICIGMNGKIIHQKTFGIGLKGSGKENDFNIKSLASPITLTSAIMILADENKLSINDPVYYYLPGFESNGKENITIKSLLLHNSGIGKDPDSLNSNWNRNDLRNALVNLTPKYRLKEQTLFTELNLLLLQFIVEQVTGESLDQFVISNLFDPIGMKSTKFSYRNKNEEFLSTGNKSSYISYKSEADVLNGIMKGVTGFGDFHSTTTDLAVFSQMMLQKGYYAGKQFLSAKIIKEFTTSQLPESYSAPGWQTTVSETEIFEGLPVNSFGFNTPSGSSLWIDPDNKIFIILLIDCDDNVNRSLIHDAQQEVYKTILNN